jgi:UDP-N-acetylmuramoyl-tripeptide--D-alanyl-D-alanine ligase
VKPTPVEDLARLLGGQAVGFAPGATISGFATDNREVKPGDLFLAIKGSRVDGHDFVADAVRAGAAGSLVERPIEGPHILVPNLVDALARMAAHFRSGFPGPVVGVTGSAGKTTTKELIAAALSPLGSVLKTEGNRNTEFTAPLLWADLTPEHRAVVVEMSMRGFGQVAHLASFSKPTIGLITNIGYSHVELVGSREGVAKAKGELLEALPSNGVAILWKDDPFTETLRPMSPCPVRTYGFSDLADCRITHYTPLSWSACAVRGTLDGYVWEAEVPAVGRHIAVNAAGAILAASAAGVAPQEAASALATTVFPPMRMAVEKLNGATILLDTYNASPASMVAAIETLAELPCEGRRMAVIGEMKELGNFSDEGHRIVGRSLASNGIGPVLFYGDATEATSQEAVDAGMKAESISVARSLDDVTEFLRALQPGDVVLVKGSRALELEQALLPLKGVRA